MRTRITTNKLSNKAKLLPLSHIYLFLNMKTIEKAFSFNFITKVLNLRNEAIKDRQTDQIRIKLDYTIDIIAIYTNEYI